MIVSSPDSVELQRLRKMLLIRRFEERVYFECCMPGYPIGGFVHLCSGQEAVAVGMAEAFQPGRDYLIANVRHHGHSLAIGMPPEAAMAELFGREAGCCHGMGGSMHFFNAAAGDLGGILHAGSQAPLGIGAAFTCAHRKTGGVCFIMLGDGSVNTGALAESMNLASLWKLPAVFIVENNGIAISTVVARACADPDLLSRGRGYAIPRARVDGNDVEAVVAAAAEAATRAREGAGPSYIVADTYRFRGYSMSDAMKYRTKQEQEQARLRDPISLYAALLKYRALLTDALLEDLEAEATSEINAAARFAREAPHPPAGERFKYTTTV